MPASAVPTVNHAQRSCAKNFKPDETHTPSLIDVSGPKVTFAGADVKVTYKYATLYIDPRNPIGPSYIRYLPALCEKASLHRLQWIYLNVGSETHEDLKDVYDYLMKKCPLLEKITLVCVRVGCRMTTPHEAKYAEPYEGHIRFVPVKYLLSRLSTKCRTIQ